LNFEAGYPPNINIISLNIMNAQKVVADSLSTLNTHNRHRINLGSMVGEGYGWQSMAA